MTITLACYSKLYFNQYLQCGKICDKLASFYKTIYVFIFLFYKTCGLYFESFPIVNDDDSVISKWRSKFQRHLQS
jgi:hypothetical protein